MTPPLPLYTISITVAWFLKDIGCFNYSIQPFFFFCKIIKKKAFLSPSCQAMKVYFIGGKNGKSSTTCCNGWDQQDILISSGGVNISCQPDWWKMSVCELFVCISDWLWVADLCWSTKNNLLIFLLSCQERGQQLWQDFLLKKEKKKQRPFGALFMNQSKVRTHWRIPWWLLLLCDIGSNHVLLILSNTVGKTASYSWLYQTIITKHPKDTLRNCSSS